MTMREVVDAIIKPDTAGRGAGYALLQNADRPLRAAVLVSHAWDAKYSDLVSALAASGQSGPFWICAMALYQPEDTPELTLERQMGSEAGGLLAAVLGHVALLLCVLTTTCNIYTRLWCLFEIFTAVQSGVQVDITSRQSGRYGLGALEDALLKLCEEPIETDRAVCGCPVEEEAIREALRAVAGGLEAVDQAVEESRLAALVRGRDRLQGGGWKDTPIGRQYQDAINVVSARLGKASLGTPKGTEVAVLTTPPGGARARRLNKAWSETTWAASGDRGSPSKTTAGVAGKPPPAATKRIGAGGGATMLTSVGSVGSLFDVHDEDKLHNHRQQNQSTPRTSTRQHWCPTTSL